MIKNNLKNFWFGQTFDEPNKIYYINLIIQIIKLIIWWIISSKWLYIIFYKYYDIHIINIQIKIDIIEHCTSVNEVQNIEINSLFTEQFM